MCMTNFFNFKCFITQSVTYDNIIYRTISECDDEREREKRYDSRRMIKSPIGGTYLFS